MIPDLSLIYTAWLVCALGMAGSGVWGLIDEWRKG